MLAFGSSSFRGSFKTKPLKPKVVCDLCTKEVTAAAGYA